MENSKKADDQNIQYLFDLKGSTINRFVSGENLKKTTCLKDINLQYICAKSIVKLLYLLNIFNLIDFKNFS